MSVEKNSLNIEPNDALFTVSSKRTPKVKASPAVLSRPVTFTFTDGEIAGAIKFIKKDDIYMRDGKAEKYPTTKITIQTVSMDKPFNLSREIYLALTDALANQLCADKIKEWEEE